MCVAHSGPPKVVGCPLFRANGAVPNLLHNFISKLQEDFYASKEEGFPEIGRPQVWTSSKQASGECHAPEEARHAEVRQGWEGGHGEEPQTGHRHRALGGSKKGSQGSQEEGRIKAALKTERTRAAKERGRATSQAKCSSKEIARHEREFAAHLSGEKLGLPALVFDLDGTLIDRI